MGNPLETLVAGMTQIQEVLPKGRSANETAEYDPSKSVVEFPKLKGELGRVRSNRLSGLALLG